MKNSIDKDASLLSEEGLDLDRGIVDFTKFISLSKNLKLSGIKGACGYTAHLIFLVLLFIPFVSKNIYRAVVANNKRIISKDAVYDFLKSTSANWRSFLTGSSLPLVDYFSTLDKKEHLRALSIDDTNFKKDRSNFVELLSKCWDHCIGCYFKGFRLLNFVWTDGCSKVPLGFTLLASRNETKRYNESTKKVDPRSNSARRREEAVKGSPDAVLNFFNSIVDKVKPYVDAVVFDSWFSFNKIIFGIAQHIPVVCMVKKNYQLNFSCKGGGGNIESVYRNLENKRRGAANIIGSMFAYLIYRHDGVVDRLKCKIVFVRCKHNHDWIPLLCTDPTFSDQKIVNLYGLRWKIEEFHRETKQLLSLETGSQSTDYDALCAYISVVYVRHMFLSYRQRFCVRKEDLSIESLFYGYSDEVRQITFEEAWLNASADALEALCALPPGAKTAANENAYTLKQLQKVLLNLFPQSRDNYIGNELAAIINRQKSIEKSGRTLESRLNAMLAERQVVQTPQSA